MNDFTMTITIQTRWTYELFEETMNTFEKSLNRTLHIGCPHDTKTMLHNIATWANDRGHTVLTIDEDRMMITVKKKPRKIKGVYQLKGSSKPPAPPTSGSNAIKPKCAIGATCDRCGRVHNCVEFTRLEKFSKSGCGDYISQDTHRAIFNNSENIVPTYTEFADKFRGLTADQEWELISLYRRYIEALEKDWSTRYTYCSGCFKDVRRDNTYTEITKDGRLLIKCKDCNTIWYVRDVE